jgi:two-component system sensor histidine kinase KdpD
MPRRDTRGYAAGAIVTMLATIAAGLLFGRQHLTDVVMTYLLGVVVISMRFGFRVSLATAILSVLAFDFFFIPPYLTFTVADLRHVVTFAVMLLVAVVIAGLTQRVKDQAEVARRSERRTAVLYAMSRELSQARAHEAVLRAAAGHIEDVFDARTAIYVCDDQGELLCAYASQGLEQLAEKELGIVRWVRSNRREAGLGTDTVPGGQGLYLPLSTSARDRGIVGVLGIFPADAARFDDPEQRRLADALAMQIAMAIERSHFAEETQRARVQVEAEQLRSTLLSSVSHDLRTPLAVMKGAASTLVDDADALSPGTRRDLAQTILEETERLERLVANLLDMTRLESGAVQLQKEWQSIEEIVGGALVRVEPRLAGREVTSRIPAQLSARFDAVLMEQALVNLLENAAKHTPEGTPIEVNAAREGGEVVIEVADRGPGLPPGEEERVFEKFHRAPSVRPTPGVGLGLAICRAIATVHGGRIWAQNRPGGGASFKIALPLEGEAPDGRLPEIEEKSA